MIWFGCKKCGKRHGRPDNLAGTMIFCDCGHGNRVPWSSTVPEPVDEEPPQALPLPPPRPSIPVPPRPSIPVPPRSRPPFERDDDYDRPRPFRRLRETRPPPNPAYCLNHTDTASEQTCADCRCSFCAACVVTLQGKTLCAPCKNFRVRGVQRATRLSGLAIVAVVVSLVSGPVTFCLTLVGAGSQAQGDGSIALAVFLSILGGLLPAGGLILGAMALREIETKPHVGGRGLAMAGTATALVGVLWSLTVVLLVILKYAQT